MSDGLMMLVFACIRCNATATGDPETVPSVWVHADTRCSVRPDGTPIEPGEPGTHREPLCEACAHVLRVFGTAQRPILQLFPLARTDRIQIPGDEVNR